MADVGDIIEIPYQEGDCARCGWVVTRDKESEPWSGRRGGDCRRDDDGVHHVVTVRQMTCHARIAEGIMTSVVLMNGGKVVMRQVFPGPGTAWQQSFMPAEQVAEIIVSTRTYRYHAAMEDNL